MIKDTIRRSLGKVLPRRVRDALLHLSFSIDREEFEKFAFLYAFAPNMNLGLARLKERGFSPQSIIDAGSHKGDMARLFRSLWQTARLAMIEPNLHQTEMLRAIAAELGAEFHVELLGATDGTEVTYHVMGPGSSVYEERSGYERTTQKRTLRRLDSVLSGWESADLIKVDAQGYELEILKGASRLLPHTASVLLEISVIEINKGAPLLHEVIPFMMSHGFIVCEILELHRRPLDRALSQLDFLFVREDSPLMADKRHWQVLEELGTKKGYGLVGCQLCGVNSFFVRNDPIDDHFASPFTSGNHFEPYRCVQLITPRRVPRITGAQGQERLEAERWPSIAARYHLMLGWPAK